ncbi:MAG: hypothetical protein EBU96_11600 [Actinobacteria bacterium]|nr:hypothetical protein [Actinomycetota bacterium]
MTKTVKTPDLTETKAQSVLREIMAGDPVRIALSILLGFRLQKPGTGHLPSKRALSAFLAHHLLDKSLIRCSDYLQDNLWHSACKVQASSDLLLKFKNGVEGASTWAYT